MRKKTEAQDEMAKATATGCAAVESAATVVEGKENSAAADAAATVVEASEEAEGSDVSKETEGTDASEAAEGAPKKKERTYIKKEDVINDEIYREFMAAPMREKQARALIRMYQMGDLIRQRIRFGKVERTLLLSKQSMFAHEVYINGEWKAVEPKAIWSWGTT